MYWSLAEMILDLVQNSIEADAKAVTVEIAHRGERLVVSISDDGRGMDKTRQAAAMDPFFTEEGKHPGRRVGLGLPFLQQTVEQTGGTFRLQSEVGVGTIVDFSLMTSHIDIPPAGDLVRLVVELMCFDREYELRLVREYAPHDDGRHPRRYEITRSELREVLGEISTVENRALAEEYVLAAESSLHEQESEIV
jgi:anti-sigma regulatory factor (Ser/Thr protein kinase)